MEDRTLIVIAAMIMLTLIMMWALYLGINGTTLAVVIGIFGFIVGIPAGFKYQESRS